MNDSNNKSLKSWEGKSIPPAACIFLHVGINISPNSIGNKKQRHFFANEGPSSKSYGLSSNYVWMWELNCKESEAPKNWCFWTWMLEKTLESPLDCKEIQPVNLKGNQPWIFVGRTHTEAEIPIFWPPDVRKWLIGNDPDAGKDWRHEKETTEDEMVGWHHQLHGHESEQSPGVSDG